MRILAANYMSQNLKRATMIDCSAIPAESINLALILGVRCAVKTCTALNYMNGAERWA